MILVLEYQHNYVQVNELTFNVLTGQHRFLTIMQYFIY